MSTEDERIEYAISHTVVLRPPTQRLATFGNTSVYYYLITQPSYEGLPEAKESGADTVVREGRVIAERPRVVTPHYLVNLQGFSDHARHYIDKVIKEHGRNAPGILYNYRNESKELSIVSSDLESVVHNLSSKIDTDGDPLATIIKGVDDLWDVSLLKFVLELTRDSVGGNIAEMGSRGLLDIDRVGIPRDARISIERMFFLVGKGDLEPSELKLELERWGVFEEYQDRFFRLFKK